jgi:ribosomal protein L11 methyltransferase
VLWCEVRLRVALEHVEMVADVLREIAPGGVSIEEPVTILGPEEGVQLEPDRPAALACWLLADDGLGARLDQIDARLAALGLRPEITTRRADDAEWAEAWKEHFHVTRIGRRTVVRPSWREYDPRPDEIVIDLDPGMAFGTGQHETTRSCLEEIEAVVGGGSVRSALDVGTGTGVLAAALVRLGVPRVVALDTDAAVVPVARANLRRNRAGAVALLAGGVAAVQAQFDLVVANILADALIAEAGTLESVVAPSGQLVVSGVLDTQADAVVAAFPALRLSATRAAGPWRTLRLRR